MGLSIAISGGIIMMTLLAVGATIFVLTNELHEKTIATSKISSLDESLSKLEMKIRTVEGASGNDLLNFTISNNGTGKFWDYENFNVIIVYDANIAGVSTKTVEQLVFNRDSSLIPPAPPPSASIIFDDSTHSSGNCNPTCTFNHNNGGTTDMIIIVGVAPKGGLSVIPGGVTYDGLPLTKIRHDDDGGTTRSELWYRLAPSTGVNTVSVELNANDDAAMCAATFENVDQGDPIDDDDGLNDGDGTTGVDPPTELNYDTSIEDVWIVDMVGTLDGPMSTVAPQIEICDRNRGSTRGAGSYEPTTTIGTYTMDWTNAVPGKEFSISAAALIPTGGIVGTPPTCDTSASFGTGDWIIDNITTDLLDSQIVNTGEIGQICTKLSHPIFANGDVDITIITDLGHVASKSVIVT